ncbi:hypothetical protein, partial [Vibrio marinisediminis]
MDFTISLFDILLERRQAAVFIGAPLEKIEKILACRELSRQGLSDSVQPVAIAVANTVAPLAVS